MHLPTPWPGFPPPWGKRLAWGVLCQLVGSFATAALAAPPPAEPAEPVCWRDQAVDLGIDFHHNFFPRGDKQMPENMGAGVALLDANGDGRLDIYLVQGAPLPVLAPASGPETASQSGSRRSENRLYLQGDDGHFRDATAASGLGHPGYGMGVTVGDVDGDGERDLYLTNFGPDVLYRNRGDGTFEEVTGKSGLGLDGWSTGAAFLDLEGDGDLDLFVSRYLTYDPAKSKWCGNGRRQLRSYCHPDVYPGAADVLYRNRGDGTFEDISRAAGLRPAAEAKGLGVLTYDFDADGHQDIYVANDSTMNYFYRGDGRGGLREEALISGLGFNAGGAAEASMGLAFGDLDGDGRGEILVTHLDQETNTLYRPLGGLFEDQTRRAGLDRASLPWVGFGTVMLDVEHDGDLDIFVANGHIIDNIALFDSSRSHRQPAQLFLNDGRGRFVDASPRLGLQQRPLVGRGVASGDLDNDGDLDLVVTQNGDRVLVLHNACSAADTSLAVLLRGRGSAAGAGGNNTEALGARLELRHGDQRRVRHLSGGGSYLSSSAPALFFGLGEAPVANTWDLTVTWPNGATSHHEALSPGATYVVTEGRDRVQRRPFGSTGQSLPEPSTSRGSHVPSHR